MQYVRSIVLFLVMISLFSVSFIPSSSALEPIFEPGLKIKVNNGNLIDPEIPVPINLSKAPVVLPEWSIKFEGRFQGEPIVATDGTVYVTALVDKGTTGSTNLLAYSPEGTLLWKIEFEAKARTNLVLGPDNDIYIVVTQNNLIRFNQRGEQVKTYKLPYTPYELVGFGPDGALYYTNSLEAQDGMLISYDLDAEAMNWNRTNASIFHTHIKLRNDGTVIYLSSDMKTVFAVADGAVMWKSSSKEVMYDLTLAPGNMTYVTFREADLINSVNAEGSKGKYIKSVGNMYVDNNGTIYNYDKGTLEYYSSTLDLKFRLSFGDKAYRSVWIGANNLVYVWDERGNIVALLDGIVQWSAKLNLPFAPKRFPTMAEGPEGNIYLIEGNTLHALRSYKLTKMTLNKSELTLKLGDKAALYASVEPYKVPYPHVNWSTSNQAVASVDNDGQVTASATGQALITATTLDDKVSVSATVNVIGTTEAPLAPVTFSDIEGHKYKSFIEKAVSQGITEGYPDGTFQPEGKVTRAEFAVLLMKALKIEVPGRQLTFKDRDTIPEWASERVAQAFQTGTILGYPDGTFQPKGNITHAEMVSMVMKSSGALLSEGETKFTDDVHIPKWARAAVYAAENKGIIVADEWGGVFSSSRLSTRAEAVTSIVRLLDWLAEEN